jgi:DNA-binding transcriptional LysR family regulator
MTVFDPVLLRTFLVVAEAGSFTGAARLLGLRQPTVSQHVRRLEQAAGRTLLLRDTHSVELTGDGEAMIGFARAILDANERAAGYFAGPELRGRLRFGVSEDFVLSELPAVLAAFRRSHPLVDVELTVELAGLLHQRLRAGELDLVLGKRMPGETAGAPLWTDRLVWIGGPGLRLDPDAPVPLIAYPDPSITRRRALEVLRRHGLQWRIACTSGSLNGLRAAALAGLGVTLFARSLIPDGLAELAAPHHLPAAGETEFVLSARRSPMTGPAAALARQVRDGVAQLHAVS